jgi:uncharacterized membrane protein
MRSSPSLLARALEPVAAGLWVFFVIVSLLEGTIWAFGLGDGQLAGVVPNHDLFLALQWLLQHLDLLWITLAAANAYLCLAGREGVNTARRWGMIILLAVVALAWISTKAGFPLGPIEYSRALLVRLELGPRLALETRLGPVPVGLPLFWFAVIIGAREGLLRVFPRWSHFRVALGTGLLALLTDFSLEPLASKLRGFWFWRSGTPTLPPVFDAPLTGCLAWGLMAGLIAYGLRERTAAATVRPRSWQPAMALVIFHAVFLAAHLGRWARG